MVKKDDLRRANRKMAFGGMARDVFPVADSLKRYGVVFGGEADPTMGGTPQR